MEVLVCYLNAWWFGGISGGSMGGLVYYLNAWWFGGLSGGGGFIPTLCVNIHTVLVVFCMQNIFSGCLGAYGDYGVLVCKICEI